MSIWERAAGPYQAATLVSVGNIARTYAAAGDIAHAIEYQRRSDAILEKQLALNMAVGSERQKLLFVSGVSERTDRTISLHLVSAPTNPDASALAALVLLQRKGRVLDEMADTFAAVRQRVADAGDRQLLDRLKTTTAELARFAYSLGGRDALGRIASTGNQGARSGQGTARSRAQRAQRGVPRADAAGHARSGAGGAPGTGGAAGVCDLPPVRSERRTHAEAYGAPHYAAYVVRRQMPPQGVDLGPAAPIDKAIDDVAQGAARSRRGPTSSSARATLDELVMQPLRAWLRAARSGCSFLPTAS